MQIHISQGDIGFTLVRDKQVWEKPKITEYDIDLVYDFLKFSIEFITAPRKFSKGKFKITLYDGRKKIEEKFGVYGEHCSRFH